MNKPEFVIVDNVPIFDESEDYPLEKLRKIISACNRRIEDTGDETPIVIGHTKEDAPEKDQPEVVGFASKFRLGQIGKTKPRKAILATFKFFKDKWELARKFPRRSIELWDDGTVDPISLLGATSPARDLTLVYAKQGKKIIFNNTIDTSTPNREEDLNPEELVKQCLEALEQSDVFKYVRSLMDSKDQQEPVKMSEEEEQDKEDMKPEQYSEEEDNKDEDEQPEKVKMQRDSARRELARFQKQYQDLSHRLQDVERKGRIADRKATLLGLEQEGFLFSMADELEDCSDMTPQQFSKHLGKIRKCYQRSPVGVNVVPAPVADTSDAIGSDEMQKAIALACKNKVSFTEALSNLRRSK